MGIRKRALCRPVPVVGLPVILEEEGVGLAHVVLNMPAINKERSIRELRLPAAEDVDRVRLFGEAPVTFEAVAGRV